MYFKLSIKNVSKSFKDFTLYFLTLSFSVCIFYIFNSIEAQKAMMVISKSTASFMQTITKVIGVISIFISVILAFLIVYANSFLIRRRKKELGIYMILGMEKGKMARMLVTETFLIGVLSLASGLLMGIFLSQGLSVITAKLFEVDMTGYHFIFSIQAFSKTILYFGIIFILVMIFSTFSVSKCKLIKLLNADKQNEKQKLKRPSITITLFILSVLCLGVAYKLVLKNGILIFDNRLLFEVILGALGTFLFFASLSGFFLKLLQLNKRMYYKGLNMFVLRQINSKVNTAHISMSFICLMLFCTIGILSTGLGVNNVLNDFYRYCAPYDASFMTDEDLSIIDKLKDYEFDVIPYADKYLEFHLYESVTGDLTKGAIFGKVIDAIPKEAQVRYLSAPMYMIKLSDFNKLMKMQGVDEFALSENQVAIYSDYAEMVHEIKDALTKFMLLKSKVTISKNDYEVYPDLMTDGIVTNPASGIMVALIVTDKMTEDCKAVNTILSLNCVGDRKGMQMKLESDLIDFMEKSENKSEIIKIQASTAETVKPIAAS